MKKEELLNMVGVTNDYGDEKTYLLNKEDVQNEYKNNEAFTIKELKNVSNWQYKGSKELETGYYGYIFYDPKNNEYYLIIENAWTSGNQNRISYATIESITEDKANEYLN